MARALTVAVLGAGGTIAPAIVRDLGESEEVERMLLLDLDRDRAAEVAYLHGCGKADVAAVDATDGLADRLAGCDVLLNSASYRVNVEAMRAALEAGCHYLDLGGLYWMTDRQLELNREFEQAGRLAILGIGSSPGKTNVMAAHAVRELERVDEVHVSAAGRDVDPPAGLSAPYALRTLIDELTLQPVVVRAGQVEQIDPLTPGGEVDFGPTLGQAETIYTLHSELRTFPDSFGCREASFRLSLDECLLARLRDLAAAPAEALDAAVREVQPPSAQTVAFHVVEATGGGKRVRVFAQTDPSEAWGLGGGVVSTGSPAAASVRLIARGRITATGVQPPERCIDPDDLFPELERRGCEVTIEVVEGAGV